MLITRGDSPDIAMVGMLARRLADNTEPAAVNVDLTIYDTLTTSTADDSVEVVA